MQVLIPNDRVSLTCSRARITNSNKRGRHGDRTVSAMSGRNRDKDSVAIERI
jgi:hypothetical protein